MLLVSVIRYLGHRHRSDTLLTVQQLQYLHALYLETSLGSKPRVPPAHDRGTAILATYGPQETTKVL
jgi:hypothetical protein